MPNLAEAAPIGRSLKTVLVAALALGGAVQVMRFAIVQQNADSPEVAAMAWPDHPRVALGLAMAQIGAAAGAGRAPPPTSVALSQAAARRAPLAIEPFLIEGAIAQSNQRAARAQGLFTEAARRDPRSAAARYFLAQLYLSSGKPEEGLRHATVLVRLVAGGSAVLVPAIATYAQSPGAVPTLRAMFARDHLLRDAVLSDLARDAGNYDLIVSLAGDDIGKSDPAAGPGWKERLLTVLVERGDFARARALWLRISGLPKAPAGIVNPQFARLAAPAPFNWTFGNGEFGFAEPAANASLQVVYYGRTNGQLASQTLLLAPGAYQLRMRVMRESDNDQASGLAWTLSCGKATDVLLNLPVGEGKGSARPIAANFTVPAGCLSQTIKLVATASEYAASEQVNFSNFQLVRMAL